MVINHIHFEVPPCSATAALCEGEQSPKRRTKSTGAGPGAAVPVRALARLTGAGEGGATRFIPKDPEERAQSGALPR